MKTRLLLLSVALLLTSCVGRRPHEAQNVWYEGYYPPVTEVTYERNGHSYTMPAIEGQVRVYFTNRVSHDKAVRAITSAEGEVIAQIPSQHYYLVNVGKGRESAFIRQIQSTGNTSLVLPNAVYYPKTVKSYVLDNYKEYLEEYGGKHGDIVSDAFGQYSPQGSVANIDIGDKDGGMIANEESQQLEQILSEATEGNPVVINMSYGPELNSYGLPWSRLGEGDLSDEIRDNYREECIVEILDLLNIIAKYDNKDFVIVKASGNEGIKDFEKEILKPLNKELNKTQIAMLDKHFMFVSALDNNDRELSNELKYGSYHKWVTTVDISDYEYKGTHVSGTSIASPRLAGYISSAAQTYNIPATEVLEYVRKATKADKGRHLLTQERLNALIAKNMGYVDLGLSSGTVWKKTAERGLYDFIDANKRFGDNIPTKEQLEELRAECDWEWRGNRYIITGPNGNRIELTANGMYDCEGILHKEKGTGGIWSSSDDDEFWKYCLEFNSRSINVTDAGGCCRYSVLLASSSKTKSDIARNNNQALPPLNNKNFPFEYYGIIPYSQDMFKNGAEGVMDFSSGEQFHYKYIEDMDFIPTYSIKFKLEGEDVRKKYKLAALETIDAETAYIGSDDDYDNSIEITISVFGSLDLDVDKLYIIAKRK